MQKKNAGFSLTEMAIVLTIISLITVGAFEGIKLLESARLKSVISDIEKFKVSVNSFYSKYRQYPGDFNKASQNWQGAIDGNNDGKIEFMFTDSSDIYEGYNAWQHMSFERVLDREYKGTKTAGVAELDIDIPRSSTNGGYFLLYEGSLDSGLSIIQSNVIVLATPIAIAGGVFDADGNLTPLQASTIDSKIDDGMPSTGNVKASEGNSSLAEFCAITKDTVDLKDDIYDINNEGKDCMVGFKIASD